MTKLPAVAAPVRGKRPALVLLSLTFVLLSAGCGGGDDGGSPEGLDSAPAESTAADGEGGSGATIPSGCPVEAPTVAQVTGRELPEDGEDSCRFSDGVAAVEVVVQGSGLFEVRRSETAKQYDNVEDAEQGDRGYIATDELHAEAYIESGGSSLTVILSSFELDQAGYKRTTLALVDAILG